MNEKIRAILLMPFTALYGIVISIRNILFDWGIIPSREFNIPIIGVGNLAAGGTGKTPHIEYLIRLLEEDFRVAVLSRGYKRKTRGFIVARTTDTPATIGDEACQVKRKFPGVLVAVDEKRVHGIRELMKMKDAPDVILLDDAFQHRHVKPGLSILLDDFNQPSRSDYLLPSGRLRESFGSKKRADIILVTKTPIAIKPIEKRIRLEKTFLAGYQQLYFTRMTPGKITGVFGGEMEPYSSENKKDVLLLSGIAQPRSLKLMATGISNSIREITFRDHHKYSERDAVSIRRKFMDMDQESSFLITTEKDAVKLMEFEHIFHPMKEKMFYFPIFVEFLNNDEKKFNTQLLNYVKSNKRNRILHKA